ncbi:hypothetical protein [Streptococcus dysgalactiae]|uniref:hypothetical protein n=1 Tax=Streptococcus dysgalactiae TaxID=1334 RepID=UPI00194ECC61|nr:hypothetical protein [Streptococcus dysgalactiae]MBM6549290.1 hypothetical protein [Streptococcus dysgalactiae subsp. equisimilis]
MSGEEALISVQTVNSQRSEKCQRMNFRVESVDGTECLQVDNAYSVHDLPLGTACLPKSVELSHWKHLSDVVFKDIGEAKIEILLGCDTPEVHWPLDHRIGGRREPFAVKTVLGWVLLGPLRVDGSDSIVRHTTTNEPVEHMLSRLWDHDFGDDDEKTALSLNDIQAIEKVQRSLRLVDGHFVIGLPWICDNPTFPDNRWYVMTRLMAQGKDLFLIPKCLTSIRV